MKSSALVSLVLSLPACFDPNGPTPGEDAETEGSTETETGPADTVEPPDTDAPPDDDDGDPTGDEPTDTSDGETDGPDTDDPPPVDCDADAACPAEVPFCVDDVCATCLGAPASACADAFPSAPVCHETGTCVGCTGHDQCASGACDSFTGSCFEADNVLHVDNQVACGGSGTAADPMCRLADALDTIDAQPTDTGWIVRLAGSASSYDDQVRSREDHPIAILGATAGLTPIISTAGAALHIGQGRVYVAHVRLESAGSQVVYGLGGASWLHDVTVANGGADTGILLQGGELEAHEVAVGSNFNTGIDVQAGATMRMYDSSIVLNGGAGRVAGDLELHRCEIADNYVDGGLDVTGSLLLVNSFVHDNYYVRGGIEANGPASLTVVYSTITDGLECPTGSTGSIRSSIVIGGLDCSSLGITASAVDIDAADQGMNNIALSFEEAGLVFVDLAGGDLHVLPDSTVADLAEWHVGDPATDIDGDPRPDMDGAEDSPGADVP